MLRVLTSRARTSWFGPSTPEDHDRARPPHRELRPSAGRTRRGAVAPRVRRFRVPVLPQGRPGDRGGARAARQPPRLRVPPLPTGRTAPVRPAGRGRGGGSG